MKKIVLLVMQCFPLLLLAQQAGGIKFEKGLTWEQAKQKARQENKFIFVDCYATWCAPCKKMEKEVFSQKDVGDAMNGKVISIRVQMDTSKTDDAFVKSWYADAHSMRQQYNVTSFPSYLFFSPEGNIVHRYLNALPDSLFLKIATNALNSEKQYYTLLNNYLDGKKDYSKLPYLADISKQIGETALSNAIATDYISNYLNGLNEKELFQKKTLEFANSNVSLLTSTDKLFKLIYKKEKHVDELIGQKDFSKNILYAVITREEINLRLWPDNKPVNTAPNWENITTAIRKKYDDYYTDLVVVDAQLKWYQQKKDRPNLIKAYVVKFDKFGLDTAGIGWALFNNVAYNLFFKHCNNKDTLAKMIHWMEIINKNHPDDQANMDTYANLLYKVGRKEEAIAWQEKALELEKMAATKENRDPDAGYAETLEKMKKGIPTW